MRLYARFLRWCHIFRYSDSGIGGDHQPVTWAWPLRAGSPLSGPPVPRGTPGSRLYVGCTCGRTW